MESGRGTRRSICLSKEYIIQGGNTLKTYEHKTIHFKSKGNGFTKLEFNTSEMDRELNTLGAEGWRVVSSYPILINGYTTDVYYTLVRERV